MSISNITISKYHHMLRDSSKETLQVIHQHVQTTKHTTKLRQAHFPKPPKRFFWKTWF